MPLLWTPKRQRLWKPGLGQAEIDWSHPLAWGLKLLIPLWEGAGEPRDVISGQVFTRSSANTTWRPTTRGPLLDFDGTLRNRIYNTAALAHFSGNVGTVFAYVANIDSWHVGGVRFLVAGQEFTLTGTGDNDALVFSQGVLDVGISNFVNTGPWAFVFASDGTAAGKAFYANGVARGTANGTAPTAIATGAKNVQICGYPYADNYELDGQLLLIGLTDATWNQACAQQFYADPFCFLRPTPRRRLAIIDTSTMASYRLHFTGAETGSATYYAQGYGGNYATSTSYPRTGTYSMRCYPSGAGTGYVYFRQSGADGNWSGFAQDTLYARVPLRIETAPTAEEVIYELRDSVNSLICYITLTSGRVVKVYDSTQTVKATGSTDLGTGAYKVLGIKIQRGSSGACEVQIDGQSEVSGTGNFGSALIDIAYVGKVRNLNGSGYNIYFDDVAFDSKDFPDVDGEVQLMQPNANGNYTTNWTASAGELYECVDEVPPSSADYAYTSTTDAVYTAAFESASAAGISGVIEAVRLAVLTKSAAVGGTNFKARLRVGTYDDDSSTWAQNSTWAGRNRFWASNPANNRRWTTSDLDGIEAGLILTESGTAYLGTALIEVEYVPEHGGESTETITLSGGGLRVRLTDGTDTLTGGSRVRLADGQHVLSGGLRIQTTPDTALSGGTRVETSPTITPVGGVRVKIADGEKTLPGGSRVRLADGQHILSGGSRVQLSPSVTPTGGVRVLTTPDKTLVGGCALTTEGTQQIVLSAGGLRVRLTDGTDVLSGGARVEQTGTHTPTGGARVQLSPTVVPTGGVRVQLTPSAALPGGLRVRLGDGTDVLQGGARVAQTGTHAPTGGVRVLTTGQHVLVGGLALEEEGTGSHILGGGVRVLTTPTKTPTGGVRVRLTDGTDTLTGGARTSTPKTIALSGGCALILSPTKTLSGGSRVLLTKTIALVGGSRVAVQTPKTLTGGSRVYVQPTTALAGGTRVMRMQSAGLVGGLIIAGSATSPHTWQYDSRLQRTPTIPSKVSYYIKVS